MARKLLLVNPRHPERDLVEDICAIGDMAEIDSQVPRVYYWRQSNEGRGASGESKWEMSDEIP